VFSFPGRQRLRANGFRSDATGLGESKVETNTGKHGFLFRPMKNGLTDHSVGEDGNSRVVGDNDLEQN